MLHVLPNRKCVVSLQIGEKYADIGKITIPTFTDYASRVGADFHLIQQKVFSNSEGWRQAVWEKLQLKDLFEVYERILFIDLDCYITRNCPNIFHEYRFGTFAGANYPEVKEKEFLRYLQFMGKSNGLDGNSGVFLVDKPLRHLLEPPSNWLRQSQNFGTAGQMWLFCNMFWNDVPVRPLKSVYHQMRYFNEEGIFHVIDEEDKLASLKLFADLRR